VAFLTRARCGLQKNRFFNRALSGVVIYSQSCKESSFIGDGITCFWANAGSAIQLQCCALTRSLPEAPMGVLWSETLIVLRAIQG
jgi:hypothetical protein